MKVNESNKYIYNKFENKTYIVICFYVNDLLICNSNIHFVNNMKSLLCNKFNMNDLRESVILGIKFTRLEKGSSMD